MKIKFYPSIFRMVFLSLFLFISISGKSVIYLGIPNPVECGNVQVCIESTTSLYIVSMMSSTDPFTGTLQQGTSGPFELECVNTTCCPNCVFYLLPNTNCLSAQIKFKPTVPGGFWTSFTITSHPDCYVNGIFKSAITPILINVHGTGIDPTIDMTISPPSSNNIGNCFPFQYITSNIELHNAPYSTCLLELEVVGGDLDAPFSLFYGETYIPSTEYFFVEPGNSVIITVRFDPSATGSFQSQFKIYNNSTNLSNLIWYTVMATSSSPPNPNMWDMILVDEYGNPEIEIPRRIYFIGEEENDYIIKKAIPNNNQLLTFNDECGATIIQNSIYVADQRNDRVIKVDLATESFTTILSGISLPHDIQYIQGDSIYILTQKYSNGTGSNSLIMYNINNYQYTTVDLSNLEGSPTRLVNIRDTLYISTYYVNLPIFRGKVYWFLKSALTDGVLNPNEATPIKSTNEQDRFLSLSKKSIDTLFILSFKTTSPFDDTLFLRRKNLMLTWCSVGPNDIAPFASSNNYPGNVTSAYLLTQKAIQEFDYQTNQGTLNTVFPYHGGSYLFDSPITKQIGDIQAENTTTYKKYDRSIASIYWAPGNLPASIQFNHYLGVRPPNSSGMNCTDEFWEIHSSSGSDYTYNLTLFYNEKLMSELINPDNVAIALRENNGIWTYHTDLIVDMVSKTITLSDLSQLSNLSQFAITDGSQVIVWTGDIDHFWTNTGNWYPNKVPRSIDNVVIPSNAIQMPIIDVNGLGCHNLILETNATITINPGIIFNINSESNGSNDWQCGENLTIFHSIGTVAPVYKLVTYGTITNIPGELSKCWITSNLGADHQATAVNDNTEASAGWYWQFNSAQGFKHDGTSRTPPTTWITSISENSNWLPVNDPCALELGSGWHIPTNSDWYNVDASGGWINWDGPWNSALKMHAAGGLSGGSLSNRGSYGFNWSSTQYSNTHGLLLVFNNGWCYMGAYSKAIGASSRCLRD